MRGRCIISLAACFASLLASAAMCDGQEQIHITFDGPPPQPPGSSYVIQRYDEAGMSFSSMNTFGLARVGSNPPTGLPDNGTAYLDTGLSGKLMFRFTNGATLDLISVALAEYSPFAPEARAVHFGSYRFDGSVGWRDITRDRFVGGPGPIKALQACYFGPEF